MPGWHLHHLWGLGLDTVLKRILEAPEEGVEIERALKWFLILPQALLRQVKGGAAGRSLVAARFNAISQGNWGAIFERWQKDREKERERRARKQEQWLGEVRVPEDESESEAKLRKKVLALLGQGKISKAVNLLNSHGVADTRDPRVMATIKSKYRQREKIGSQSMLRRLG